MSCRMCARRVLALAGAFLLGICSFVAVPNVAALEDDDCESGSSSNYYMCKLVDYSGVPDDLHLVVGSWEYADDLSSDDEMKIIWGEDRFELFKTTSEIIRNTIDSDSPEYREKTYELYDELGFIPQEFGFFDMHLEDETDNEVPYDGKVTISYEFGNQLFNSEGYREFMNYTSREWEPSVLHIKKDGQGWSREYLPATVDDDGVWTFTTNGFSAFVYGIKAIDEEEPPKTLDNTAVFIGAAGASVAGMIVLSAWFGKKERR